MRGQSTLTLPALGASIGSWYVLTQMPAVQSDALVVIVVARSRCPYHFRGCFVQFLLFFLVLRRIQTILLFRALVEFVGLGRKANQSSQPVAVAVRRHCVQSRRQCPD